MPWVASSDMRSLTALMTKCWSRSYLWSPAYLSWRNGSGGEGGGQFDLPSSGKGGWFVIFRLFKSILFFVNWISMYFFHFIKYYLIYFIIIVFWLGFDRPSGLLLFVPAVLFFHSHASLLSVFVCLIVLFHSCCSHAWVFGKTLLHDFPISYSHNEWYFVFSLFGARETKHAQRTLL